jgi:hypothetical protein
MTVDDPRLEQALVELIGHVMLFADLAPNEDVDLDSAVRLQEAIAWDLRRLGRKERDRVARGFVDFGGGRDWDMTAGASERASTLRQMPAILGLIPSTDDEPADGVDRGPVGPAAISRKLAVVTGAKAHEQARRQAEALRHNRGVGRWEVPTRYDAIRAGRLLVEAGTPEIGVHVVPFAASRIVVHRVQPLIEAFFDCFCFAELTSDDLLDPDWAVSLEEDMAWTLRQLPKPLRLELASLMDDVVGSMERSGDGVESEQLVLLRELPQTIGLLEGD